VSKKILILQGHPDSSVVHFGHALAQAYRDGATAAGHQVREVDVGRLDFPLLRRQADWQAGPLPPSLQSAQEAIGWAEHLVIVFPLWLGDMPALLKAFLEQVARPGFAFVADGTNPFGKKGLAGRSARVVVTMGMPALVYRYYFLAHSVKSLERNILGFVGIAPVHRTLIGSIEALGEPDRAKWLDRLHELGRDGA
jgi:putative NADPH-quinone reductase